MMIGRSRTRNNCRHPVTLFEGPQNVASVGFEQICRHDRLSSRVAILILKHAPQSKELKKTSCHKIYQGEVTPVLEQSGKYVG